MPAGRTVWVVGVEPGDPTSVLAEGLAAAGGQVRMLSDLESAAWMADIDGASEPRQALPSLIVASSRLALAEGAVFLTRIAARQPWTFLPVVVCAGSDDEEECDLAYRSGAASWVVVPADRGEAEEVSRIFARYWMDTTLLPDISPQARL